MTKNERNKRLCEGRARGDTYKTLAERYSISQVRCAQIAHMGGVHLHGEEARQLRLKRSKRK